MKSANNSFVFEKFTQETLANYTSPRKGETKLGERIQVGELTREKIVILGICEDIGPRANLGNRGGEQAFDAFLSRFLNMQSNKTLRGDELFLAGSIRSLADATSIDELRSLVHELDSFVLEVLAQYDLSNKQLIVVGGGHNNAYPIIKHFSINAKPLNILNIDPHADCRPIEGRHSGNPFSTAILENHLASYTVLGLHERYNSESILQFLEEHRCTFRFFEQYLDDEHALQEDVRTFSELHELAATGIEIDLDCIQFMPASAYTPSGFTVNEIRKVVRCLPKNCAYLHLPEGAPTTPQEAAIVGKTLAYLISDFITCQQKAIDAPSF